MNIQRVARHGFEMHLAKYISKPEKALYGMPLWTKIHFYYYIII